MFLHGWRGWWVGIPLTLWLVSASAFKTPQILLPCPKDVRLSEIDRMAVEAGIRFEVTDLNTGATCYLTPKQVRKIQQSARTAQREGTGNG